MNWLSNLSLKAKLGLLASCAVVGLVVFGVVAYTTLITVKINGAKYKEIDLDKTLLADILTPPASLVRMDWFAARIVVNINSGNYQRVEQLLKQLKEARQEYAQRQEFWRQYPDRYELMPFESASAKSYIALMDDEFIPSVERKDWQKAVAVRSKLDAEIPNYYEELRESERAVMARLEQDCLQADALVRSRSLLMGVIFFAVLAAASVLSFLIARQILSVVSGVQRAAEQLAQGDLTARIPVVGRDELGQLANSINQAIQSLASVLSEARHTAVQVSQQVLNVARDLSQMSTSAQQMNTVATDSARCVEQMTCETQRANEMMTQLRAVVQESARGAEQTAQAAQNGMQQMHGVARVVREVAQGAEQTAQAASTGVERMHTIVARIRETFQQLQETQQSANQASQIAQQGRTALQQSQQVMVNIDQQTRHVASELQELATLSASIGGILQTSRKSRVRRTCLHSTPRLKPPVQAKQGADSRW